MQTLIFGDIDCQKSHSIIFLCESGSIGKRINPINRYISKFNFVAGARWSCDAAISIEKKARSIRKHLSEAIEQLALDCDGIIHIGLDTLDVWDVENERYLFIINDARNASSEKLKWLNCNLFSPDTQHDEA